MFSVLNVADEAFNSLCLFPYKQNSYSDLLQTSMLSSVFVCQKCVINQKWGSNSCGHTSIGT